MDHAAAVVRIGDIQIAVCCDEEPGSGANPSGQEIDLYALAGSGSSGGFTVSEIGFSNAPCGRTFTQTAGANCTTIATASPASGTAFTATVVTTPAAGPCTLSISDGGLHPALSVTLTYTATGLGVL